MKIDNFDHLIQLLNTVTKHIKLLDERDMKECPNMEDYQFVEGELHKLIKLEATIEYPYWIRLHTTAEDLMSQIRPVQIKGLPMSKEFSSEDLNDHIWETMLRKETFWHMKPEPNFIVRCVKKIYTKVSSFLGK